MEGPETGVGQGEAGRAPFQYSLRTMFIVVTAVGVALSGIFAGPPWLSLATGTFLGLMAPMVLTILLIYGRGYMRTFCIGALFPAGLFLYTLGAGLIFPFLRSAMGGYSYDPKTHMYVGIYMLVAGVAIVALGLLAMGVRWMVEAAQRRQHRKPFLPGDNSATGGPAE